MTIVNQYEIPPTIPADGALTASGANTIVSWGNLQSPVFSDTSGYSLTPKGDAFFRDLTATGKITVTAGGVLGGFDIGADYLRDTGNSFGLTGAVTTGNDIRFWAGSTLANAATAPFRVYEDGSLNAVAVGAVTVTVSGALTAGVGSDIAGLYVHDLTVDKLISGTMASKTFTLSVTEGAGDSYFNSGKTDFTTTQPGLILGIDDSDSNRAKLYLGDSTHDFHWDGVGLQAGGWNIGTSTITSTGIVLDSANQLIQVGSSAPITIDWANKHIHSDNYTSGAFGSGFFLDSNLLEVGNIACRGLFRTSVFQKDIVNVIAGSFVVAPNGDVLNADMTAADNSTLTIKGTVTLAVNDILRLKESNGGSVDDEWLRVTSIANAPVYAVTRDLAGQYSANSNPTWKKGAAVVDYGQPNAGGVYMTASDTNAPYLSVYTHAGSPWTDISTKLRLGNLNGFLGYSTDLYGIAIGETEKYLKYDPTNGLRIKGNITITNPEDINTSDLTNDSGWGTIPATLNDSPSGSGLFLGANYLGYFNDSTDPHWKTYMDSSGNFYLGGTTGKLQWNAGADTLNIIGSIFTKGNIQGSTMGSTNALTGKLLVTNSDSLSVDMTAADNSTLTILGNTTFAVDDFLYLENSTDIEWMRITNISSAPTYVVTRDLAGAYSSGSNPIWKAGTPVVKQGSWSSTEGNLYTAPVLTGGSSASALSVFQALGDGNNNGAFKLTINGTDYNVTPSFLYQESSPSVITTTGSGSTRTMSNYCKLTSFEWDLNTFTPSGGIWHGVVIENGSVIATGDSMQVNGNGTWNFTFTGAQQIILNKNSTYTFDKVHESGNTNVWDNWLGVSGYKWAHITSMSMAVDNIQSALRTATSSTETVTYDTDHFIITGVNPDYLMTITSPSSGTDISGAGATKYLDIATTSTDGGWGKGGWLRLIGEGTNSPYYSVFSRNSKTYNDVAEACRLGNLNGFLDYTSDIYGIAIGDDTESFSYDKINGIRFSIAQEIITGTATINDATRSCTITLTAPTGKRITSGGFDTGDPSDHVVQIVASYPSSDTTWVVKANLTGSGYTKVVTAYAICTKKT